VWFLRHSIRPQRLHEARLVKCPGMPFVPRPLEQLSNAITESGLLVSEEDQQIQRIMDVKESQAEGPEKSWLAPDVQVVLWFVFLCCFTQGIVSGFHW